MLSLLRKEVGLTLTDTDYCSVSRATHASANDAQAGQASPEPPASKPASKPGSAFSMRVARKASDEKSSFEVPYFCSLLQGSFAHTTLQILFAQIANSKVMFCA